MQWLLFAFMRELSKTKLFINKRNIYTMCEHDLINSKGIYNDTFSLTKLENINSEENELLLLSRFGDRIFNGI